MSAEDDARKLRELQYAEEVKKQNIEHQEKLRRLQEAENARRAKEN